MSLGGRMTIAVASLASAVGFGYATRLLPGSSKAFWMAAALCLIITASCFRGKHTAITNRLIGAVIFLVYVAYLVDEIRAGNWMSASRAETSAFNALIGLVTYGLPGAFVMIRGRMPFNLFERYDNPDDEDPEPFDDEDEPYLDE